MTVINEMIAKLTEREGGMVRLRYGIDDASRCSTAEVAAAFGTSEVGARGELRSAVEKLRAMVTGNPGWKFALARAGIPLSGDVT